MSSFKKRMLVFSSFNYMAYMIQSYMLFIMIGTFKNIDVSLVGIFVTFIGISTLFVPKIKDKVAFIPITKLFVIFGIFYLISQILILYSLYKINIYLFLLGGFLNYLFYSLLMQVFKYVLYDEKDVKDLDKIGNHHQIIIEIFYSVGMLLGGFLLRYAKSVNLVQFDIVMNILFLFSIGILFTKHLPNKEKILLLKLKNETNKQDINYILVVSAFIGYLLFKQDDNSVSYMFNYISDGTIFYGVYTVGCSISGILGIKLLSKMFVNIKHRVLVSITLMAISLVILAITKNLYLFMLAIVINGAGVSSFLGSVKAYLKESNLSTNQLVNISFYLEEFAKIIASLLFLTVLSVYGNYTYALLIIFVLIFVSIMNFINKS